MPVPLSLSVLSVFEKGFEMPGRDLGDAPQFDGCEIAVEVPVAPRDVPN